MKAIAKKLVVDEHGAPLEVILPWPAFCEIAETLGWDLDSEAETDLRETRHDLEAGRHEAFQPLTPPVICHDFCSIGGRRVTSTAWTSAWRASFGPGWRRWRAIL